MNRTYSIYQMKKIFMMKIQWSIIRLHSSKKSSKAREWKLIFFPFTKVHLWQYYVHCSSYLSNLVRWKKKRNFSLDIIKCTWFTILECFYVNMTLFLLINLLHFLFYIKLCHQTDSVQSNKNNRANRISFNEWN